MNQFQKAAVVALTTLVAACGRSKPEPNSSLGELTHPTATGKPEIPPHLRGQVEKIVLGGVVTNEDPDRYAGSQLDSKSAEARRIMERAAAGVPPHMQPPEGPRGSMLNGPEGDRIKEAIETERLRLKANIPPEVQAAIDKARADAARARGGG